MMILSYFKLYFCWSQIHSFVIWLKCNSNSICPKWTHVSLNFVNLLNFLHLDRQRHHHHQVLCSKQSRYFSFFIFSLLHHLTHACWINSTSNYLLLPSVLSLPWKPCNGMPLYLELNLSYLKWFPKLSIIFSYAISPLVPWASLYSSHMLTFFSPLGLGLAALSTWFRVFLLSARLALPHHSGHWSNVTCSARPSLTTPSATGPPK